LVKAVQGSDVVFGVTNYWEKLDDKEETQQGKNIVDAAKVRQYPAYPPTDFGSLTCMPQEAKVGLLIWSSLRNVTESKHIPALQCWHFAAHPRLPMTDQATQ
jgi:hypothetical protein